MEIITDNYCCASKNVTSNLSLVFTTRKIWHLFSFFLLYLGRKSLRLLFASALLESELIFLFHTLQKNSVITSCNCCCFPYNGNFSVYRKLSTKTTFSLEFTSLKDDNTVFEKAAKKYSHLYVHPTV